jgi:hypothetical protein
VLHHTNGARREGNRFSGGSQATRLGWSPTAGDDGRRERLSVRGKVPWATAAGLLPTAENYRLNAGGKADYPLELIYDDLRRMKIEVEV